MNLTSEQMTVIQAPLNAKIFLEGPAGSGKTTAAVERLLYLMEQGIPGSSILIIAPQRTLTAPYAAALRTPGAAAGGVVDMVTVGGLAQRMVELFWPVVAEAAGFAHPDQLPVFLTLETAQYYMAHLIRPRIDAERYFDTVVIDRNRLYSQIIDNLNKAAVVGFLHTQIGERLQSAWGGDPGQMRIYAQVQDCASFFREYCLAHNLLDFSLQLETFRQHLWNLPACRGYLQAAYRHLIAENIEEDNPVAHDLLLEWLPDFESALLVCDQDAGYRRFLGADPLSAYRLKEPCDHKLTFSQSLVMPPAIIHLGAELTAAISRQPGELPAEISEAPLHRAVDFADQRFFPQMLDWTASRIASLVHEEGIPPGEIAVLAPYLSDALRYALTHRLESYSVPSRSHRPSRSLREEPGARCLLTLAALAHPDWNMPPTRFDLAYTLMQSIAGLDLVRAQLLTEIVYRQRLGVPTLSSFDQIKTEVQERITYLIGERFERLRLWLEEYRQGEPLELDYFLSRLFGEVLSQPGFGFHGDYSAGEIAANLVESVYKFRRAVVPARQDGDFAAGQEYLLMVQDGVIAAQYIRSWQLEAAQDAVLLAPAYTFLISNRPVEVQFWLSAGSQGWFERLFQPLTHPYVLSRLWRPGETWDADDEYAAAQDALIRLIQGLLRRCRSKVYLGLSELNEQGYEQRGQLLVALQRALRRSA